MEYEYALDPHLERKFEVYDINWPIENFSLVTCGSSWLIQSPVFSVRGYHVTKWLITLAPASSTISPDFMVFTLKRCDSDGGPDSVYVEWRLIITISENEEVTLDRLCTFGMGTECRDNLKSLKYSIEMIKSFQSDRMTIRCTMIVYSKVANEEFEPCQDKGKSCLSENLYNMFLKRHDWDLQLKIGSKAIFTHKAIVVTRIQKLNNLLKLSGELADDGSEIKVIDVSYLNHEAMKKIVEYAYSGDLKHVLSEPSLAILDCVKILDIHPLKNIYAAKELTFRTCLDVQETKFKWIIDDFFSEFSYYENSFVSPELIDDLSTTWRLHISSEYEVSSEYLSVYAENVGQAKLGNMCVELAITDECGRSVSARLLRKSEGDGRLLRENKFICLSYLRYLLIGNALRLTMKLKLARGDARSYIEKQDTTVITKFCKTDSFDLLSQDMLCLFQSKKFCDCFLLNNGEKYAIHKSIVSFRCSFLSNLFNNENSEAGCVIVNGIQPYTFKLLLTYIYTGVILQTEHSRQVADLRKTAIMFNLPLLAQLCEDEPWMKMDNKI